MDRNKVFNRIAEHLLNQGKPCTETGTDSCLYRGPNGMSCAIGCLIPDDKYDPQFENIGIQILRTTSVLKPNEKKFSEVILGLIGDMDYDDIELLKQLQNAHDDAATNTHPKQYWGAMLLSIAKRFNVKMKKAVARRLAGYAAAHTRRTSGANA